jgi:hypothetical protein
LPYPKKGDVLTVSSVHIHHNIECAKLGIVLLTFEEIKGLPGQADKTINGDANYLELEMSTELVAILESSSYEK